MNLKQYLMTQIENTDSIDRCLTIIGTAKVLDYLDFLEVCNQATTKIIIIRSKQIMEATF